MRHDGDLIVQLIEYEEDAIAIREFTYRTSVQAVQVGAHNAWALAQHIADYTYFTGIQLPLAALLPLRAWCSMFYVTLQSLFLEKLGNLVSCLVPDNGRS